MRFIDLMMSGRFAIYVVLAYAVSTVVLTALVVEALARGFRWSRRARKAQSARERRAASKAAG